MMSLIGRLGRWRVILGGIAQACKASPRGSGAAGKVWAWTGSTARRRGLLSSCGHQADRVAQPMEPAVPPPKHTSPRCAGLPIQCPHGSVHHPRRLVRRRRRGGLVLRRDLPRGLRCRAGTRARGDGQHPRFQALAHRRRQPVRPEPVDQLHPELRSASVRRRGTGRTYFDELYERLSTGGVLVELGEYPFSSRYAWVCDRFSMTWRLTLTDPAGEPRPFVPPASRSAAPTTPTPRRPLRPGSPCSTTPTAGRSAATRKAGRWKPARSCSPTSPRAAHGWQPWTLGPSTISPSHPGSP